MKRDMDYIRSLLQKVEKDENLEDPNYSEPQLMYHLELMDEAGLIVAHFLRDQNGEAKGAAVQRLTNKGHDFLEASRNSTLWAKFKSKVAKSGSGMTVDIATDILKIWVKGMILGDHDSGHSAPTH